MLHNIFAFIVDPWLLEVFQTVIVKHILANWTDHCVFKPISHLVCFRARRVLWVHHCVPDWSDVALWGFHIWGKRTLGAGHWKPDICQSAVLREQQEQGKMVLCSFRYCGNRLVCCMHTQTNPSALSTMWFMNCYGI